LKSYATEWLTRIPKPSTVHFYRDHVENHIVPALGHILLTDLTRKQCPAFTLSLLDKKLAHSSRVGILHETEIETPHEG
jgi:hypothetical protein